MLSCCKQATMILLFKKKCFAIRTGSFGIPFLIQPYIFKAHGDPVKQQKGSCLRIYTGFLAHCAPGKWTQVSPDLHLVKWAIQPLFLFNTTYFVMKVWTQSLNKRENVDVLKVLQPKTSIILILISPMMGYLWKVFHTSLMASNTP